MSFDWTATFSIQLRMAHIALENQFLLVAQIASILKMLPRSQRSFCVPIRQVRSCKLSVDTLWFQLEDMFQLIVTSQSNEKVTIQLKDTPSKVYAIGAELSLSKVPLEVLQN